MRCLGVRERVGGCSQRGLALCAVVRFRTLRWLWIEFDRAIRTARLNGLPHVYLRPIDVMVYHGPQGDLVLRLVSRLDAFSGYPFRTWLPGYATGVTTGAPEVRPSRSSRTRESASQVSNTHSR